MRAGPPPHVPAPSGIRKAHVSLRVHSGPFSARCAQIHRRSWTGRIRVSQNRYYIYGMKTAPLTAATQPAVTSTVGALSDRELLRETPPRTAPARRRHRPLDRDRGARPVSAARLLQPVRLRGARARLQRRGRCSAHRRHAAVRRSTGRAGGVARRLADAERRRGAAVGLRPAAAPRVDLRHRGDRTGGDAGGRLRAGRTVGPRRAGAAAAGAGCGGSAATRRRGGRQERPAGPPDAGRPGPGAGAAVRPGAPARRRPLRAEGDYRRGLPAGARAAPGAALARGPAHDDGTARRPPGAGGARPPRPEPATAPSAQRQSARGREGKRPANSDAGAGATAQRSGGHRGGAEDRPGRRPPRRFDDERRGDPRRRRSHTGAGGSADTDLCAAPSTQEETARRAATGAKPTGAATPTAKSWASGRAISAGVRRQVWQRDGGRCSYADPQTGRRCNSTHLIEIDHIVPHALGGAADPGNLRLLCGAHHRHRHAQGRSTREPAP